MKHSYYTGIACIIFFLLAGSLSFASVPGTTYHVTRVNDGNTISIRVKSFAGIPLKIEQVRLIGVDAPGLRQEPWGSLAKKYLKKLINQNDWIVNIEFDTQQRDRNGKLTAYLWNKKGELINEKLLESGYVRFRPPAPNIKYAGRLAAAAQKAHPKK